MTRPTPDDRDPIIMTGARTDDGLYTPPPRKPAWWRRALLVVLRPLVALIDRGLGNVK